MGTGNLLETKVHVPISSEINHQELDRYMSLNDLRNPNMSQELYEKASQP